MLFYRKEGDSLPSHAHRVRSFRAVSATCRRPPVAFSSHSFGGCYASNPKSFDLKANFSLFNAVLSERGGFEPPNPQERINGFRDRPIRPLSHLSNEKCNQAQKPVCSEANTIRTCDLHLRRVAL